MSTWVLLRGLMRESRHWGDFPVLFQHAMDGQVVVTLDFPGNGCLNIQTSPSSVEEMADYARSCLKQLGHAPPYQILALSLGAMVAVVWSEQHPEELEKMVLINTSLTHYSPFYHRLRPKNYLALILLLYGSATQRESLILKLTSTRSHIDNLKPILDQWIAYAEEFPITRGNILRQFKAAISYRAKLTTPSTPVLLLAGKQDQLVNVKCSMTLAKYWGCVLCLHPTASHDLPLDDSGWVIQQIKDWINFN